MKQQNHPSNPSIVKHLPSTEPLSEAELPDRGPLTPFFKSIASLPPEVREGIESAASALNPGSVQYNFMVKCGWSLGTRAADLGLTGPLLNAVLEASAKVMPFIRRPEVKGEVKAVSRKEFEPLYFDDYTQIALACIRQKAIRDVPALIAAITTASSAIKEFHSTESERFRKKPKVDPHSVMQIFIPHNYARSEFKHFLQYIAVKAVSGIPVAKTVRHLDTLFRENFAPFAREISVMPELR